MSNRRLPSSEDLRSLLRYDKETGLLFWLARVACDAVRQSTTRILGQTRSTFLQSGLERQSHDRLSRRHHEGGGRCSC